MCERKKNDIIHYLISHFRSKERKRQHIAPDFVVNGREVTYEVILLLMEGRLHMRGRGERD